MDILKRFSSLSDFSFWGSTGLSNSLLAESGTKPGWTAGHHRPESNFLSAFPWHTRTFLRRQQGHLVEEGTERMWKEGSVCFWLPISTGKLPVGYEIWCNFAIKRGGKAGWWLWPCRVFNMPWEFLQVVTQQSPLWGNTWKRCEFLGLWQDAVQATPVGLGTASLFPAYSPPCLMFPPHFLLLL